MMKRNLRRMATLAAICMWLGFSTLVYSSPVTINFSDGVYTPPLDAVYTEDGFTFSVPAGNHTDCGPLGADAFGITPYLVYGWHNAGGNAIVDNDVTLASGGMPFDLISLDIVADPFGQNQALPPFTIDFTSSAGMTMTVAGNVPGTIDLNWTNITSFMMSINDEPTATEFMGRHNGVIDNVVVNSPVPAPGAILLGTIGTGLVGWLRRRRTM